MIHGVLEMHNKKAKDIAKPLREASMLAHDEVIDRELVSKVLAWGHSRVFVYTRKAEEPDDRSDIVGVLLVKKLLGVSLEESCRVDSVTQALKDPPVLAADENLLSVLNKFQDGTCHLAIVREIPRRRPADSESDSDSDSSSDVGAVDGRGRLVTCWEEDARNVMFCTLEDVIESMLKEDIYDEEDLELGKVALPALLQRQGSGAIRSGFGGLRRSGSSKRFRLGKSRAFST